MFNIKAISKIIWLLLLTTFSIVNAATVDHFEVVVEPGEAQVWEAVDITITALDEDNNIIEDFEWWILVFSETDPNAEYPWELAENSYVFKLSDEWTVKFENWIKFSKEWEWEDMLHEVSAYDFENEEIFWKTTIKITEWESEVEEADIEITSPNNWLTIWKNEITISWQTVKNHKVQVVVNNTDVYDAVSNDSWTFETEIKDLPTGWEISFQALVFNSEEKQIWESHNVIVTVNTSKPSVKSINVNPYLDVEPESNVVVELLSSKNLKTIQVIVNDIVTDLNSTNEEGKYIGNFSAPTEAWEYKVDVTLMDELGHEVTETWVKTITVIPALEAAPVEPIVEEIIEEEIVEEEIIKEEASTCNNVTWIKVTTLKTKNILSWNPVEEASSYKVYKKNINNDFDLIETVTDPRVIIHIVWEDIKYNDFTVKASCIDTEWNEIESEEYSEMTKIQTGPTEIFLLLLLSLILWWVFFIRKKA